MRLLRRVAIVVSLALTPALPAASQALLDDNNADNAAQAVERAYEYPRDLPDFAFAGASADPNPRFGLSITYEHRELAPKLLTDIHLYRAARARLPSVALEEGIVDYFQVISASYEKLDLDPAKKSKLVEIKAGDREWEGRDHSFEFKTREGTPSRSYTLLFYDAGHLIKLRGSTPRRGGVSARELRKLMLELAGQFLARARIVEPFGHQCGPPEFTEVDAVDPRARTFSAEGREYYLPRGLDRKATSELIGSAMTQSISAALEAGCLGDDVRVETNDGK